MDNVSPAHRCTSPLGVVPVGLGDGVGLCRGAASFPENRPFISLGFFSAGTRLCRFFRCMVLMLDLLLDMLVAKREPAPCYHDAYSVGIPKGVYGEEERGEFTVRPQFPPVTNVFFLVSKRTLFFLGSGGMDASHWSGQASWAW